MLGSTREVDCDFPLCDKCFDSTDGARVAAVRNGDIVAFCANHSVYLISQGVNLRTLEEVRSELGIEISQSSEELLSRAKQDFVRSLK